MAKNDFQLHVCLSLRMYHLGSHWTYFHEIWYWGPLRKSVDDFQSCLKSDKNVEDLIMLVLFRALRNILYLEESAKGSHCFIPMATLNILILFATTFKSTPIQRESIFVFPWLRERAHILRRKFIASPRSKYYDRNFTWQKFNIPR
jgi:hypothetical protein